MPTPDQITHAFVNDAFTVTATVHYEDVFGVAAAQATKKAYYVMGTPFQMGYLTGLLAEPDVARMTTDYLDQVAFDMLSVTAPKWLGECLVEVVEFILAQEHVQADISADLLDEMRGLVAGCRAANSKTPVEFQRVLALNAGIDVILSMVYPLELPSWLPPERAKVLEPLFAPHAQSALRGERVSLRGQLHESESPAAALADRHAYFRAPILCNAFSVSGEATASKTDHFFGRDFTFPTCGILQDAACHLVRFPIGTSGRLPTVSVTVPGFVGSIAALNPHGFAMGVNMVPAGCCNPSRPGENSLLLVRDTVDRARDANAAEALLAATVRGVSWLYPFAAAEGSHRAGVFEIGASKPFDPSDFPPKLLVWTKYLPNAAFVAQHPTAPMNRGVVARFGGFQTDPAYATFNTALFELFELPYDPENIAKTPLSLYFAPLLLDRSDVVVATNAYLVPEMRLTSMYDRTLLIAGDQWNDIQVRYNTLCQRLTAAIAAGGVDHATARSIISFLGEGKPGQSVEGTTSLFDMTQLTVESLWGHYGDAWTKITLPAYLG